MKIVVGLGNPGAKYETTRHNVGWLALDRLIEKWKASGPSTRNQGEVFQAEVAGEKVLLVKPLTFMNLSGRCVGPLFHFFKCQAEDLIVLHDELDLDPFQLRLKTGGGTGGHNGLKSIDEALGAEQKNYHRVRIGIGHPSRLNLRIAPVDFVLQPFSDSDLADLDSVFDRVEKAAHLLIQGKVAAAMNEYNRKTPPVGDAK